MGCVYRALSKTSRKCYVGLTTGNLKYRMMRHKQGSKTSNCHFYRAIRKYGFSDFKWTELIQSGDIAVLNKKEIYFIELYNSYHQGYNETKGGGGKVGCPCSEETKQRIGEANKDKKLTEKQKKKHSKAMLGNTNSKGSKCSEETKKNMLGNTRGLGYKFTDKQKQNVSRGLKKAWQKRKNQMISEQSVPF